MPKENVTNMDGSAHIRLDPTCSICASKENLIRANDNVVICKKCSDSIHAAFSEDTDDVVSDVVVPKSKNTPSKIVDFVNQYVIGQDDAKRTLAIAIYNHYKRIDNPVLNGVELQKSNILMVGPSGSGKTHLVQSIARMLDVPFYIADATTVTEAGFVGNDVESMLHALIANANGDVKKAERGIILCDEVDKIAKKGTGASLTKDPSGEGVQQALLKLIEGTDVEVQIAGGRRVSGNATQKINTSNILFVFAGAFVGLDSIIAQRSEGERGIGFGATVEKTNTKTAVTTEDLIAFGMIPEFVGRIPIVVELDEMKPEHLVRVLTEPKNSIIRQFSALMSVDGAELVVTDAAIEKIAELAYERKTGARGLRSIVENVLMDTMFELPDCEQKTIVTVDVADDDLTVTKSEVC